MTTVNFQELFMPNTLSLERLEKIREVYLSTPSIRTAAKTVGVSRQTVRRYIVEQEGWNRAIERRYEQAGALKLCPVPTMAVSYKNMDWSFLDRLFEKMRLPGENLDFEKHIRTMTDEISVELGASGSASDLLRLETAVMEFLSYRRFMIKAVQAEECDFKSMDHCARTVERWRNIADRALTQVRQIFRELEIKNRKVLPSIGAKGNLFVGPTQINLNQSDNADVITNRHSQTS